MGKRCAVLLAISFGIPFAANAQNSNHGSWISGVIDGNEGVYAATVNESQAVFGQYCYDDGGICYWLLANDLDCTSGAKYPVLVNTNEGAISLEMLCINVGNRSRYGFTDFDKIDGIVRKTTRIGIAFPLKDGYFQVSRFDLFGATRAIDKMRASAEARLERRTVDFKL